MTTFSVDDLSINSSKFQKSNNLIVNSEDQDVFLFPQKDDIKEQKDELAIHIKISNFTSFLETGNEDRALNSYQELLEEMHNQGRFENENSEEEFKHTAQNIKQNTEVMNIEMAKKSGAMALFGEKYDDNVRVVKFGNVSAELCGGTHCSSTGDIRLAKIVSETAVAAGTRRIEAVCGDSAFKFLSEKAEIVDKIAHAFKVPYNEIGERILKMGVENKNLQTEIENLKAEQAKSKFQSFISKAQDINGGKLFISQVEAFPANLVKLGSEILSSKLGNSVIVLASVDGDKINFVVKVDNNFVEKGINAGAIVNKLAAATGGKGGGRPQYAQGAGKDVSNLNSVLAEIEKEIKLSV